MAGVRHLGGAVLCESFVYVSPSLPINFAAADAAALPLLGETRSSRLRRLTLPGEPVPIQQNHQS